MLQFHLGAGLHVGLTEAQLRQLIGLCEAAAGQPQAEAARAVLAKVLEAGKE
jgi:alkylhydroperoxidase/carboxymuconolactone decarboxylase family protein YurZ